MEVTYRGYKLKTIQTRPILNYGEHGSHNGYIEIPEFQQVEYWDVEQGNIHGGWTYRKDDWYGFDTLHIDSKDYMDEKWVISHLKEFVDEYLAKSEVADD